MEKLCSNCMFREVGYANRHCLNCNNDYSGWEKFIPAKPWQPQIGKSYWHIYIDTQIKILRHKWRGMYFECQWLKLGLVCRTRKEAREKIKGIREVLER